MKKRGAVFLIETGGKLLGGNYLAYMLQITMPFEGGFTALNGDILACNPVLKDAFAISSMGILVNAETLKHQLSIYGRWVVWSLNGIGHC